jgi:hypothetical protein
MVDHVMPSLEPGRLLAVNSMPPVRYADGSLPVGPRTQ